VKLQLGPFDTTLHIRSRDHFRAICREAALQELEPDSPPRRWEAAIGRFYQLLRLAPVTEAVDRAYLAGEPAFSALVIIPDESVPEALAVCVELQQLQEELERWTWEADAALLAFSEDIHRYDAAFLDQARAQLEAEAPPPS
jgi:hypothetical protein